MPTSTGAARTRLVVNAAAAVAGTSETINATSRLPFSLSPQRTPAKRKPGTRMGVLRTAIFMDDDQQSGEGDAPAEPVERALTGHSRESGNPARAPPPPLDTRFRGYVELECARLPAVPASCAKPAES